MFCVNWLMSYVLCGLPNFLRKFLRKIVKALPEPFSLYPISTILFLFVWFVLALPTLCTLLYIYIYLSLPRRTYSITISPWLPDIVETSFMLMMLITLMLNERDIRAINHIYVLSSLSLLTRTWRFFVYRNIYRSFITI